MQRTERAPKQQQPTASARRAGNGRAVAAACAGHRLTGPLLWLCLVLGADLHKRNSLLPIESEK